MARPRAGGSIPQARLPVPGSCCAGGQEAKRGFSHQALLSPGSASLWPTISGRPSQGPVRSTCLAGPGRLELRGCSPRLLRDRAVASKQVLGIGSSTASRRPGCLGFRPRGLGQEALGGADRPPAALGLRSLLALRG